MSFAQQIFTIKITPFILVPLALPAQERSVLAPGDRVRVSAPSIDADRLVGRLMVVDSNARFLEIQTGRDLLGRRSSQIVPFASVTTLEVSPRNKPAQIAAAVLGAGLGAAFGAAIGSTAGQECAPQGITPCFDRGSTAVIGAVIGGSAGAFIGFTVAKRDRWEPLPLSVLGVDVSARPSSGLQIKASIRQRRAM